MSEITEFECLKLIKSIPNRIFERMYIHLADSNGSFMHKYANIIVNILA